MEPEGFRISIEISITGKKMLTIGILSLKAKKRLIEYVTQGFSPESSALKG